MDTAEVTQREAERGIPRDSFRARLILARLHAGDLTIRDAAARCGLNYGSWANWESGVKPRDKIETAQAISEGLGVDYDWLLHGGPLAKDERRPGRVLRRGASQPTHYYGSGAVRPMVSPLSGQPGSGDRPPKHNGASRPDDRMWRRTRRKDRPTK